MVLPLILPPNPPGKDRLRKGRLEHTAKPPDRHANLYRQNGNPEREQMFVLRQFMTVAVIAAPAATVRHDHVASGYRQRSQPCHQLRSRRPRSGGSHGGGPSISATAPRGETCYEGSGKVMTKIKNVHKISYKSRTLMHSIATDCEEIEMNVR